MNGVSSLLCLGSSVKQIDGVVKMPTSIGGTKRP